MSKEEAEQFNPHPTHILYDNDDIIGTFKTGLAVKNS